MYTSTLNKMFLNQVTQHSYCYTQSTNFYMLTVMTVRILIWHYKTLRETHTHTYIYIHTGMYIYIYIYAYTPTPIYIYPIPIITIMS